MCATKRSPSARSPSRLSSRSTCSGCRYNPFPSRAGCCSSSPCMHSRRPARTWSRPTPAQDVVAGRAVHEACSLGVSRRARDERKRIAGVGGRLAVAPAVSYPWCADTIVAITGLTSVAALLCIASIDRRAGFMEAVPHHALAWWAAARSGVARRAVEGRTVASTGPRDSANTSTERYNRTID